MKLPYLRHAALLTLLVACSKQPTSLLDGDGGNTTSSSSSGADGGGGMGTAGSGTGNNNQGGEGGAPLQPASFEISVSASQLELRDSGEATVTIAPNGYVGPVVLSLTGTPADVTAELATTGVNLDGSSSETVTLNLSSKSDTQTGAFVISVVGTVPGGEKSGDAAVNVIPTITITIPENLASFSSNPASTNAFGDFPTLIKALPNMAETPITVNFFNADTVPHEIHADDPDVGFGHGNQNIPPGAFDPVVRQVTAPGEYTFYPHDIGNSILGRITIQ